MSDQVRIVLVILEDAQGRVALQLRSPLANIANPDHWGLFGGHVDPGKMTQQPRAGRSKKN